MSIHDDFHDVLPIRTWGDWQAWLQHMRERNPGAQWQLVASLSYVWHPTPNPSAPCPGVRIEVRKIT